jgi:hypothetical protein
LTNWLDRQESWRDARWRFSTSFAKQNSYDPARLIGSANMFDVLPDGAVPQDIALTADLETARKASREVFQSLPRSAERDSVLGALGRMGTGNLKQKIRHRAQLIIDSTAGKRFPELVTVTDEAVNCRNYFVHGSAQSFDYWSNFGAVNFMTDTLEFVFLASDLIEAGWNPKAWADSYSSMSHPLARFRINYRGNLQRLKTLLG